MNGVRRAQPRDLIAIGAFGAVMAASALAVSVLAIAGATGHWRITPAEGAYTFFLGANPFSAQGLLQNLNPEGTGGRALAAYHFGVDIPDIYAWCSAHEKELERAGLEYAVAHPMTYLWLGFLKLFTLFRPDYRMIASSETAGPFALFIVETAIALVCPIWLATRLALRREVAWFDGTWVAPITLPLQIPMFLVAADPRYRLPISILAIADTAWCWDRWLRGRAAPGQTSIAGDAAS
jgi:hypothetical protein